LRAVYRLASVWDHSAAPSSDLVPEDAQRSSPAGANRAFRDDATHRPVSGTYRCLLDHELTLGHVDYERRVVEVLGWSFLDPRHDCLEDASVQPYGMAAGS
jgi:hypothetical protein